MQPHLAPSLLTSLCPPIPQPMQASIPALQGADVRGASVSSRALRCVKERRFALSEGANLRFVTPLIREIRPIGKAFRTSEAPPRTEGSRGTPPTS